jgi:hypothetical protein
MAERIVSKKELEDFKTKFGQNMELRDLLNKERGLTRRKSKPITKDVDENIKGQPMSKAESEDVASRLYKPSGRLNSEENTETSDMTFKRGGSASSRGDGIAQRGKTKGTMIMCGGGYTKGKR